MVAERRISKRTGKPVRERVTAETFPVRLVQSSVSPIAPDEVSERADKMHNALLVLIRLGGGSETLAKMGVA